MTPTGMWLLLLVGAFDTPALVGIFETNKECTKAIEQVALENPVVDAELLECRYWQEERAALGPGDLIVHSVTTVEVPAP